MNAYEMVHRLVKPDIPCQVPSEWLAFILLKYDYEKEYRKIVEFFTYDEVKDICIFQNDWWEGEENVHIVGLKSLTGIGYEFFEKRSKYNE